MCINPTKLSNGVLVPCRKCWQCIENRVNDWVGRCIAETETAKVSHSITLTYGHDDSGSSDHVRAAVLTYSDVQKYFKLLRKHGFPLRYFAVGEYGSTKGRSHWHLVVFWQDRVPHHELGQRFREAHWPHGFSYWEEPNAHAIRYVCKYILKDLKAAERQGLFHMSKKPPLGAEYFVRLARRYVDQGLAPQDPFYRFGHVRDPNGDPVEFYLAGVSLDNFCRSYLDQWGARYGSHPPQSKLIEDYCDRAAKYSPDFRSEGFKPQGAYPWIAPPGGAEIHFSETHNSYYAVVNGDRLYWSFDLEGQRSWEKRIRTEDGIEQSHHRRDVAAYRRLTQGD